MAGKIELADLPTMDREIRERAFNYRTGRGSRRSHTSSLTGGGGGGPASPLVTMAGSVLAGYIPESGLTSTSWADQGPNGYHLSGTCTVLANQINGYSCAQGNGTSSTLKRTVALSAPGTQAKYRYTIVRIDVYSNNNNISAFGDVNELAVLMHTATDQVSQFSGGSYSNINAAGCTVGSFKLVKAKFVNSTADSIKAGGGTAVTGTNSGNVAPGGINLLGSNGGFGAVSIAEDWIFTADADATYPYFEAKFPGCRT